MAHKDKLKYITIIREPVEVFISAWKYYQLNRDACFGVSLGLSQQLIMFAILTFSDEFARAPQSLQRKRSKSCQNSRIAANNLLWDFNLNDVYNEEKVDAKIQELDEKFDLVMMVEKFQESLILMKNLFCWEVGDITNLKLNGRDDHEVGEIKV